MIGWLRTNIEKEAVLSLKMVADQIPNLETDEYHWKWLIIALHMALQNFMVLSPRGSNNLDVMKDQDAKEWLEAYYKDEETLPQPKLDYFLNLYKKIKTDSMKQFVNSKRYLPRKDETFSVKKLNQLRNDFIHFMPKSWSIQLVGLPRLCLDCLLIIKFLGWESGNVRFHDELGEKALDYITFSIKQLEELSRIYEERFP